ncbi:hypothetical protein L9F63_025666, partial [Diploptera punctata]
RFSMLDTFESLRLLFRHFCFMKLFENVLHNHTFFMIPKITNLTSDPIAFQNRFYTMWEEFGEQFL